MKKTFHVQIREVHVLTREVQAEDGDEARDLAHDGKGEEVLIEYSHTLGKDQTTVEDVTEMLAEQQRIVDGIIDDNELEELEELEEQQRRDEKNGLYPGKEDSAN